MFDLQDYRNERQKILNDERYSEKGKAEALAKLDQQHKAEARKAIKTLREEAVINALQLRDAQAERTKKANEALSNMDFGRLNYEAQAVRSKITAAENITDVMTVWENAKRSNDAYILKAWKDTSQGLITEKFGGPDYSDMKGQLFDDIQETKAEFAKVEITEEELEARNKLQEIEAQANEINQEFGTGQAVINRVFDGIRFEDGNVTLGFDYEIHKLSDKQEKPYQVFNRIEGEREKALKDYGEFMNESGMGDVIDTDFDDLRGVL